MKRKIRFNQGIIAGEECFALLEILPQLKNSFTQRKTYFEYYFKETEVELSLEDIDKIFSEFSIILNYEELIIKL